MSGMYFFKFLGVSQDISHVLTANLSLVLFFSILFYLGSKYSDNKFFKTMNLRMGPWRSITVIGSILLFSTKIITFWVLGIISFIALRELLSAINIKAADRRTIIWAFLTIPIQYWIAYKGYYEFFIIFIPVIAFILIPFRRILNGDIQGITSSIGVIHWAVMLTVFSVSHIAALFSFPAQPGFEAGHVGLVIFLIILTEFNDISQYLWGKILGKHKIIPGINSNKTWEGLIGGMISTAILAYLLNYLTFFTTTQSLIAGLAIGLAGFIGDINISAIKRDNGISSRKMVTEGRGGTMDRIDSISFTAMAFFHLAYFWRAAV